MVGDGIVRRQSSADLLTVPVAPNRTVTLLTSALLPMWGTRRPGGGAGLAVRGARIGRLVPPTLLHPQGRHHNESPERHAGDV
jgi:hypothetical protein